MKLTRSRATIFFRCLGVALALGAMSAPISAGVTVVANGGSAVGADYTTIQAAVDAAPPGEIVLVRNGAYPAFTIDGKGVHVVADDATLPRILGGVVVRNVPAGQAVTLRGLDVVFLLDGGLVAYSNQGSLRVIDCTFTPDTIFQPQINQSARLYDCADVALTRCLFRPGLSNQQGGTLGLDVRGGKLTLSDCDVEGGAGRDGIPFAQSGVPNTAGEPGKAALALQAVEVFCSGTILTGGAGGAGLAGTCGSATVPPTAGGDGGPAIRAASGVVLRTIATAATGGLGGAGGVGACGAWPSGAPGVRVDPPSQPWTLLAGTARSIASSGPRREIGQAQLDVTGEMGDRVWLVSSTGVAQSFDPFWSATLLLASPLQRRYLGTIGATGTLSYVFNVADLGPGVEGVHRCVQAAILDASGAVRFACADELVLLDQSF